MLFETLAAHLGSALDRDVELVFDASRSGPRPGERDALDTAGVDVAFMCATSYVWLTGGPTAEVDLVGAAWAPLDPRAAGRAVYFGDVLAAVDGPRSLQGLAGRRVAYNDDVSLSGYHSLRLALRSADVDLDRVELVRSGSHLRSLELLVSGAVDAAALDSNVWRRRRREAPGVMGELRAIAVLGPHPVQPVVARAALAPELRDGMRAALLAAHADIRVAHALAAAELARFVSVSDDDYSSLRAQLAGLGLDGSAVAHGTAGPQWRPGAA